MNLQFPSHLIPCIGTYATGSRTGLQLDSAYTYNSTGDAVGFRFIAQRSAQITDVYVYYSAKTGSPGNQLCELRDFNTGATSTPGTTLHASQSVAAPAANKWLRFTFSSPYTVTKNTLYWLVFADTAGGGLANMTLLYRSVMAGTSNSFAGLTAYTTANGFVGSSATSIDPCIVIRYSDGTLHGNPYTQSNSDTSNTRERGWYFPNGFDCDVTLFGIEGAINGNVSALRIYAGATAPGGSTLASESAGQATYANYLWLSPPYTLAKSTPYRIVQAYAGASTSPGYWEIEDDGTSADLISAGVGSGEIYHTIDNGAGGWTDNNDRVPKFRLLLSRAAGTAGGLKRHPGMRGGMAA